MRPVRVALSRQAELAFLAAGHQKPFRLFGLPVLVDPSLPCDVVRFQDCEGRTIQEVQL